MVDNTENLETSTELDSENIDGTQSEQLSSEEKNRDEEKIADDQTAEMETDDNDEEDEIPEDQTKKVDWLKKRLAQKDRQVSKRLREKEREIDYLRQQVSAIYQPYQSEYSPPQGQIYDPTTGQYVDEDSVDGKMLKKMQKMQEIEALKKQTVEYEHKYQSLGGKIEDLKSRYDDFEEIFAKSQKNITQTMANIMLQHPDNVDTFYDLAKNHPEKLEEIAKMPEYQQIKAINFLEFQKANNVQQKLKSNAPKPIPPVKSAAPTFVDKDSYESIYARQREEMERCFGKK